jgi:hypothetical protein
MTHLTRHVRKFSFLIRLKASFYRKKVIVIAFQYVWDLAGSKHAIYVSKSHSNATEFCQELVYICWHQELILQRHLYVSCCSLPVHYASEVFIKRKFCVIDNCDSLIMTEKKCKYKIYIITMSNRQKIKNEKVMNSRSLHNTMVFECFFLSSPLPLLRWLIFIVVNQIMEKFHNNNNELGWFFFVFSVLYILFEYNNWIRREFANKQQNGDNRRKTKFIYV